MEESKFISSKEYSKLVEESSTCPICLKLSEEAMESECCGFLFCNKCIDRLEKSECPMCRKLNFKLHPSMIMRKLIKNLPVKCSFGCGYTDTNDNIKKHYFICKFRDFTCNVHNCSKIFKRDEFLIHLMNNHSEVLINVSENFDKIFSYKIQKKIKESDFKIHIKEKNEVIIYNGNSNKLKELTIMRPSYFDEIIEYDT